MIMQREYYPAIVFSFSKRECEALALQMSKLDFNDGILRCAAFRAAAPPNDSINLFGFALPQAGGTKLHVAWVRSLTSFSE